MQTNVVSASFENAGVRLAARLFLPAKSPDHRFPCIVVTGSWTSVKEQMPAVYAQKLAALGYAALCFDFRGWGESRSEPAYLEDPQRKIEDIRAAFAFLATRPEIDPDRIAGLGICASAGYMCNAAATSPLPKAIGLVAPWLHDHQIVTEVYGGESGIAALCTQADSARLTPTTAIIEAASTSNPSSLMYQAPYYTEPDRGLIPEYDNKFNLASWRPWLEFDGIAAAERLSLPVLLVHSESAAIPQGARRFAERMNGKARMVWLDGISQFDFYDREDVVERSVQEVVRHFTQHGVRPD